MSALEVDVLEVDQDTKEMLRTLVCLSGSLYYQVVRFEMIVIVITLLKCVCVCVCACVRACVRDRRKMSSFAIVVTDSDCCSSVNLHLCLVCLLHIQLVDTRF